MMSCDPLCEICDLDNPKMCLHCQESFEGLVLENGECKCYSEKPFLNILTKTCTEKCPTGMITIKDTNECVDSCLTISLVDSHPRSYYYNDTCIKECPKSTFISAEYYFMNTLKCIDMDSYSLYEELVEIMLKDQNEDQFENQTIFQEKFEDYLRLSSNNNFFDLTQQPKFRDIFYCYLNCTKNITFEVAFNLTIVFKGLTKACEKEQDEEMMTKLTNLLLTRIQKLETQQFKSVFMHLFTCQAECNWRVYSNTKRINKTDSGENHVARVNYKNIYYPLTSDTQLRFQLDGILYFFSIFLPDYDLSNSILQEEFEIFAGPFAIKGTEYDDHSIETAAVEISTSTNLTDLKQFACYYLRYDHDWDMHTIKFDYDGQKVICPLRMATVTIIARKLEKFIEVKTEEPESKLWVSWPTLLIFCLLLFILMHQKDKLKDFLTEKPSTKPKRTLEMMRKTRLSQEETPRELQEKLDWGETEENGTLNIEKL